MNGGVPEDFVDFVSCMRHESCDFLIVGAHALAAHGVPRATGDLDVLVRSTPENAERVFRALLRFGAPVAAHGLTAADFATTGTVYQMGLPPFRIDILTEISGVTYDEAAADGPTIHFGREEARCIGLDAMVKNKRAAGRTKDLADAEALEEVRTRQLRSGSSDRVLYTALERFDASSPSWSEYIQWSGLTQLREVVSLDGSLCPSAIGELTAEDWNHNVHEDFKTDLFVDLDHVFRRVDATAVNVLALVEEPTAAEVSAFDDGRFVFCGFDLVDRRGGISALTNCGGFDDVFARAELSELGLLRGHGRANDVRDALASEHPDEPHANCAIWAIWRWRP